MIIYYWKKEPYSDFKESLSLELPIKSGIKDFSYKGMDFKILPCYVDCANQCKKRISVKSDRLNTILVLCEGDKWVLIANSLSEEDFIKKCVLYFEHPLRLKCGGLGVVEEIKKCVGPYYYPIIKEDKK
jgi:hypothetical protein